MSKPVNAVIVEDEKELISLLKIKLEKNCPAINIIGTAQTVEEGVKLIDSSKPELVFMDIRLPDGDGFEILERINYKNLKVIFITAYNQYTHKAIKFSAFDYILKPVDDEELTKAVEKYINEKSQTTSIVKEQVDTLIDNFKAQPKRIILKDNKSIQVVDIEKIIKCTSADNYVCFTVEGINTGEICIVGSLKDYEDLFSDFSFFRIHKSHLINMSYLSQYLKEGVVIMKDKSKIPVARRKIPEFIEYLEKFQSKQK